MSKLKSRYPGARPFETAQQLIFKGRLNDTEKLFQRVSLENLTVLYGKSGTGKSSLLNAGIIPKVKSGDDLIPIRVRFHAYQEGRNAVPPADRARFCVRNGKSSHLTFLDKLIPDEPTLWHDVKEHFILQRGKKGLLLVIDQFEELFTYPAEQIQEFAEQLSEALYKAVPQRYWDLLQTAYARDEHPLSPEELTLLQGKPALKVVLSIRSDRLHLLDRLDKHLPTILKNLFELDALDEDSARQAISEPAAPPKMDWFDTQPFLYDAATIEQILDFLMHEKDDEVEKADLTENLEYTDARRQKIEATQLQIICSEMERRAQARNLQVVKPEHLGDLGFIIQEYYSSQIAQLLEPEQMPARRLIEEGLVFEEEERRLSLYEGQIFKNYKIQPETLRQLVDAHLLRAEPSLSGGYTYELSHDTLVAPVLKAKRLRLELERVQEEVQRLAKEAARIKEALDEAIKEKKRRQRATLLAWIAVMAAVLAIVAAFYAWNQTQWLEVARKDAIAKQKEAEHNKFMAETAETNAILQKQQAQKSDSLAQISRDSALFQKQQALTNLKNANEALERYEREKAQREALEYKKLLNDARVFIESGDCDLALKKLKKVLDLLPNDPEALRLMNKCK